MTDKRWPTFQVCSDPTTVKLMEALMLQFSRQQDEIVPKSQAFRALVAELAALKGVSI